LVEESKVIEPFYKYEDSLYVAPLKSSAKRVRGNEQNGQALIRNPLGIIGPDSHVQAYDSPMINALIFKQNPGNPAYPEDKGALTRRSKSIF
jgi:hypothetical protein